MILLDTHAWLWWASAEARLSTRARRAIGRSSAVGISVVSCWEAAMLAHRNRIALEGDILSWQRRAIALEKLEVLGVTPEIAVRAASLQASRGGDPADWFIVATALELQVPLVSRDDNLAAAGLVEVVW